MHTVRGATLWQGLRTVEDDSTSNMIFERYGRVDTVTYDSCCTPRVNIEKSNIDVGDIDVDVDIDIDVDVDMVWSANMADPI